MPGRVECPYCQGDGWYVGVQPNVHTGDAEQVQVQCEHCRGEGYVDQ